VINQTHVL